MKAKKKDHFIFGYVVKGDGHVRVTQSERTVVTGGTKESHEQAAEFVHHVDKEIVKDPPQTPGELNMIVSEAAKKTGLTPKPRP